MKRHIMMAVITFLSIISFSMTAFAEETEKIEQQNNIVIENTEEQQTEQIEQINNIDKTEENKTKETIKIAPEDYIPVLMYHHFKTEEVEQGNGANMTIEEFEQHLKILQESGYKTLLLSEMNDILLQSKQQDILHTDQKYVVITIDDGYRSNYELAYPLLQKYNMKANISVITSRIHHGYITSSQEIDKMSWENLNEMQRSGLIEIYSHTYDHKPVEDRMYTDIRSSVSKGEEMLDKELEKRSPVTVLTYPNGSYTKNIAIMMRSYMGYDLQLTTNSGVVTKDTSVLEIPRITVNSGWTGEQLLQKIEQTALKTFQKE